MSLAYRSEATNTASNVDNLTVGKPAGLVEGDLLFATIGKDDDPVITVYPTGWTELHNVGQTSNLDFTIWVGYKIATAADVVGSGWTWEGDREDWAGIVKAFSNGGNVVLVDSAIQYQPSGSTPGVTNVYVGDLCIASFAAVRSPAIAANTSGYIDTDTAVGTGTANGDIGAMQAYRLATAIQSNSCGSSSGTWYEYPQEAMSVFSDVAPGALFGSGSAASDGDATLTVVVNYNIDATGPSVTSSQRRMGPFYDPTADKMYAIFGVRIAAGWEHFQMVGGTGDGKTWGDVAATTAVSVIYDFVAAHLLDERKIVVLYKNGSTDLRYSQFDIATETWEVDHQLASTDSGDSRDLAIALRANGELLIGYSAGTFGDELMVVTRADLTPATTWGTPELVIDIGSETWCQASLIAGDGDRMHLIYGRRTSDTSKQVTIKEDDSFASETAVGDGGWIDLSDADTPNSFSFQHGSDVIVGREIYDDGRTNGNGSEPFLEWFVSADSPTVTGTDEVPGWTSIPIDYKGSYGRHSYIRNLGGYLVHIASQNSDEDVRYQWLRQGEYDGGTWTAIAQAGSAGAELGSVQAELFIRDGDVYVGIIHQQAYTNFPNPESWWYDEQLVGAVLVPLVGAGEAASDGDGTISTGAPIDQLLGVGEAASDGVGTITSKQALLGTGEAASDGAGSLTKKQALAGVGEAASDGVGALTLLVSLLGVGEGSSDGVATIRSLQNLTGIGSAASDGAGVLSVTNSLKGVGESASDGRGLLSGAQTLYGVGEAASDGLGTLSKSQALAGVGEAASEGAGVLTITVIEQLVGVGEAASDGAAVITSKQNLTGVGEGASDGAGTLTKAQKLLGVGAAASDGAATLTTSQALYGVGEAASDGSATLTRYSELLGVGEAASDGAGVVTIAAGTEPLTGIGEVAADGTAVLTTYDRLTAIGSAASDGLGTITSKQNLAAIGSASSDGTGNLASIQSLEAVGSAASDGIGDVSIAGSVSLIGVGETAADGTGILAKDQALAATGEAAADGAGNLQVYTPVAGAGETAANGAAILSSTQALPGIGAAASDGKGILSGAQTLSGVGTAASDGTAALSSTQALPGIGEAASDGAGIISIAGAEALLGIGSAAADGTGTLTTVQALEATGAAASDGTGTVTVGSIVSLSSTGEGASDGWATITAKQGIFAIGSGASDGTGYLSSRIAGVGESAATGTATLSILASLHTTGGAASDGQGNLASIHSIVGTGDASSDGYATVAVTRGILAVGSAAADGTGTVWIRPIDFWSVNPAGHTRNPRAHSKAPVGYSKVKAGDTPPNW